MPRRFALPALILALLTVPALVGSAAEKPAAADAKPKFLRLARDDKGKPEFLETAVVRYKPDDVKKDLSIDLIGAVHVGDKSYYDRLNKEFEQYDVVLYELVAPEGTRVPKGGGKGSGHPVAILQNGMKDMLALEHQLNHVDYQAENLVHADMSPDAFSKSMTDRGESMWTFVFRMMGQQMAQQSQHPDRAPETDMLFAFFKKDRPLALKRVLAEQFDDMEEAMSIFAGPGGSTLITERNKVALKVLAEQIAAGKKKIGIFYGAGHMPDMEKQLIKDFGVHRDSERWLVSWDLRSKDKPKAGGDADGKGQKVEKPTEELQPSAK